MISMFAALSWTDIVIPLFGCTAIFLMGSMAPRTRMIGCICGLLSQPAWFWTAYTHGQWGIFVLSFWYAFSWGRGLRNNWRLAR